MNIKIKTFLIDDSSNKLCKMIFKVLHCNLLWVINLKNNAVYFIATDAFLLKHYCEKKYYLHDPNVNSSFKEAAKPYSNRLSWNIIFGTNFDDFYKSGFIYDLYNMFHIEEFVSIEKTTKIERYCFRFFTLNNRFVFVNKLLNNMPIVKCFINMMIKKMKTDLNKNSELLFE